MKAKYATSLSLLHVGKHGRIAQVPVEVVLEDGVSAAQGHVSTATEQGDSRETQDSGQKRGIGHAP